MSVFVVEDDPNMRILIKKYLNSFTEEEVTEFEGGNKFLDHVNNLHEQEKRLINLVLMDIQLPDQNGIEITRTLKQDPVLENLPVLVITGLDDPDKLPQAFEAGCTDYLTKPLSKMEFRARVQSALRLKEALDRERYMANRDGLTEIYNRRYFNEQIQKEFDRAQRSKNPLSYILCDIDYFKPFNDNYGHTAGDEALKEVADALEESVRRPGDFVARYGGEEFAVVLPETDEVGAEKRAELIRRSVEDIAIEHKYSDVSDVVTLSLGYATSFEERYDHHEELLKAADQALYRAKEQGRNRSASAS